MSSRLQVMAVLAFVFIVQLITMPAFIYRGDAWAIREETRSLLTDGSLNIPAELAVNFGEPGQYFTQNKTNGQFYSKYGIMNSILFLPPLLLEKMINGELGAFGSMSSLIYLNLWNIALSVALAFVLLRITGLYTKQFWVRATFVLLCLYSTFLWTYLRAQTVEIFQVLLFLLLMWHWLVVTRTRDLRSRDFYLVWVYAGLLSLTKVSYVLMIPALGLGVLALLQPKRSELPQAFRSAVQACWPGALAIALVLGTVNWIKFGAPWLTGYHQWRPEVHSLTGDYRDSLQGLLFNIHFSVWTNFPVIALAIFGWRGFWSKHRLDAWSIVGVSAIFYLTIGKLPSWRGEVCYGPRYFLFLMPLLALPALDIIQALGDNIHQWRVKCAVAALAVIFAYSTALQEQMNRYEFHAFDTFRIAISRGMPFTAAHYFENTHYGRIAWDISHAQGQYESFEWYRDLAQANPPAAMERFRVFLTELYSKLNYYWFQ